MEKLQSFYTVNKIGSRVQNILFAHQGWGDFEKELGRWLGKKFHYYTCNFISCRKFIMLKIVFIYVYSLNRAELYRHTLLVNPCITSLKSHVVRLLHYFIYKYTDSYCWFKRHTTLTKNILQIKLFISNIITDNIPVFNFHLLLAVSW